MLAGPVRLAPLELAALSLQDAVVRHGVKTPDPGNLVFLAVDEPSLDLSQLEPEEIEESAALSKMAESFPWSRAVYGEVIRQIAAAGAKAIVLDVHFALPGAGDEELRAALEEHSDLVVIASVFEDTDAGSGHQLRMYRPPAATILPDGPDAVIGYANFWPDADRVVRAAHYSVSEEDFLGEAPEAPPQAGVDPVGHPGERRELLGTVALRQAGVEHRAPAVGLMRYAEPGSFPTIPLYWIFVPDLWEANLAGGEVFRDKIVLLGALASRFRDVFRTPVGTLPGPELHLHSMAAAQAGGFYRRADTRWVMAMCGFMGALAFAVTWILRRPLLGLGVLGLSLLGYAGFALLVYNYAGIMLNLLYPGLTLVLAGLTAFAYDFSLERREKARVRRSLERYVSRDVVRELLDRNCEVLSQFGGTRKEVLVLFSDLRGFTALSAKSDPEALVAQLNEYLARMVGIVFRHQGTLDKFIGDAVMAVWGTVVSDGPAGDCRRGVQAALEMLVSVEELRRRGDEESRAGLHLGIGLNFGPAIFGNIGSEEKMEPTVIGDTVNVASRLEGLTKQYGVPLILGESVALHVRGTVPLRTIDMVRVKGRSQPLTVYTVPLDADSRPVHPAWLERHEEAWARYRRGDFSAARILFAEILVEGDRNMEEMLRRCRELEEHPPGPGWEPFVVWETK